MENETQQPNRMGRKQRAEAHLKQFLSDVHIVNKPFYFEGTNGKAVLLLHGWSSTPYEMRALGERLHREGYTVYAPLFVGHGTTPEALEGVVWQDWRRDARAAYEKLALCYDTIFVGGMSLGGSLALHLAQEHEDIAGLILMATPYKMRYETLAYYMTKCAMLFMKYKTKYYPRILGNSSCLTQLISYQRYPIVNAYEAFYAIKAATRRLDRITQPCMMMQSVHDHIIAKNSMTHLEEALDARYVEKHTVPHAYHNFIGDREHAYLYDDIVAFLQRAVSPSVSSDRA